MSSCVVWPRTGKSSRGRFSWVLSGTQPRGQATSPLPTQCDPLASLLTPVVWTGVGHWAGSRVTPPLPAALHLYQQRERFPAQHQRLSLGCPILDGLLGGGLPLEGITELAGRSSAGKTQLALQLCLAVQFPPQHGGLEAGAVYICTEDAFPSRRLQQLMQQQQRLRADVPQDVVQSIRFGSQIFVEHAADAVTEAVEEQRVALGPPGPWDEHISPALGITWANQLLVRLMAHRLREEESAQGPPGHPARILRVLSAPHLPPSSCFYTIEVEGVRGALRAESC
ncbi:DNA repair protein XRCC3 isoform X3 [Ictidomys tridecemlineatus]